MSNTSQGDTKLSNLYYTDNDDDSLVFYQVPKILFIGEQYRKMNANAKVLYSVLLDRIKLSKSNGWRDEKGRYYVRMSAVKGSELLGIGEKTLRNMKKILAEYGLIEEVREGVTKSNKIYVLKLKYTDEDVITLNNEVDDILETEEKKAQTVDMTMKGKNDRSRVVESTVHEWHILPTSKNDLSNNNKSNINNKQGIVKKEDAAEPKEKSNVVVGDSLSSLLKEKGLQVNQSTLTRWTSLDTEQNIIKAVQECLSKPNIKNRIGYITGMLERGYEPTEVIKDELPSYISSPHIEDVSLSKSDRVDALNMLLALNEIDQAEYTHRLDLL